MLKNTLGDGVLVRAGVGLATTWMIGVVWVDEVLEGAEGVVCPELDAIQRAFVRHGGNVNLADYPCFDDGQGTGTEYKRENPPTSYWPTVVASGDIEWAFELLTCYAADPNWPRSIDGEHDIGLGATVLMIAILKQNVDMVKLLIKNGADVNLTEFVWSNGKLEKYSDE